MQEYTGFEPKMWGPSIIGFGVYHYKSDRSKQEGDWPLVGFSPRKAAISLYILWVMIMDYCLDSVKVYHGQKLYIRKKVIRHRCGGDEGDDGYYN